MSHTFNHYPTQARVPRRKIPWGFNADHQPIGGRFDAIEAQLVEGSLFASYITYDMSPELSLHKPIENLKRTRGGLPGHG